MRTNTLAGAAVLLCAALGSTAALRAQTYERIAPPAYFMPEVARLTDKLQEHGVEEALTPSCTRFNAALAGTPDFLVDCKFEARCWTAGIAAAEGRITVFHFFAPSRDDCGPAHMAAARAAFAEAFVRCDHADGRAQAIDRLLEQPLDASDPEKTAALEAAAARDPKFHERFEILGLCKTMTGHRAISMFQAGTLEQIWLAILKPSANPSK